MFRSLLPIGLLAALTWLFAVPRVLADDSLEDASRVVFLLQYVGTDYPAAVEGGEVRNPFEYQEMTDFAAGARAKVDDLASGLPEATVARLRNLLDQLVREIAERADPPAIRGLTDEAIALLVDGFQLKPVPRQLPRTGPAAALYRDACASCHGEDGGGGGPEAEGLDPPPANFTDRERMASAAPYVFYNAITFGIEGTGMASFHDALDEQQRWDLAFFLWSFVAPEEPPEGSRDIRLPLRDLATRSTDDLAAELRQRDGSSLGPDEARALVASLRARPRPVTDHEERLASVRDEIERGVALLDQGELDEAAESVTSAYLEHFEPLEPQIDRIDPVVRQRFERGLIDFRKALRAGEAGRAREVAADLLATVEAAEALFGPAGSAGRTILVLGGFAGVLLLGLLWMAGVGKPRTGR